ncbi:hypothetical protein [Paenarthrobacter aurescens]|uniref:Uncharacterized protein n=1 Tax=Paenarthrobacter aurescens TaxID=43663 RepID=A0A4Y3N7W0_PAEAU|nr:hypothetical protein [Paenarthrobacter aurescens]MDO6145038.1 hypothetical protein [Paenarthrobacter aurescens]MDO6148883.1 hypothetical protein [Paenarthrobacter aurescens]MDO6160129.1 hypothetical protein [Paenarthrobacter aurescens]MDO6163988.1 hypothetical protein [Paenarthrobacter aurescens]GEB17297.1 hypothetical protein AAU01_00520 [Paenarthrobacter aurescens]
MPIKLPAMLAEQQEAWQAVFEIHSAMPKGWVLVGGQAVYLHAVERGAPFVRATKDADMALDIRAYPNMLHDFTELLVKLGFESLGESPEGYQHRWQRGNALLDILIPRHLGDRAEKRRGVTGGTTIAAPASQQALDRSETVDVQAGASSGRVNRPTILGSLIGKAGALTIINDPLRQRHIDDFLTLTSVIRASDLRGVSFKRAEKDHLANMLGRLANEPQLMEQVPEGVEGVERLRISLN